MMLHDLHIIQPTNPALTQKKVSIDAKRHQGDIPVPSRMAFRLAEIIVVGNPAVLSQIRQFERKGVVGFQRLGAV